MPIDVNKDQLISFSQLQRRIPPTSNGNPISLSTLHRWRQKGLKGGVVLEAVKVGSSWFTSEYVFAQFSQQLTALANKGIVPKHYSAKASSKDASQHLRSSGW